MGPIVNLVVVFVIYGCINNAQTKDRANICALKKTHAVINEDKQRRLDGTDYSASVEKKNGPGMMLAEDHAFVNDYVYPAMYYNFLAGCSGKAYQSLKQRPNKYSCPYKLSKPCPEVMKFRRADGSCNNVANPLWGSSRIPLIRFLDPKYEDGRGEPRVTGVNKKKLPNARILSTTVHTPIANPGVAPVTSYYIAIGQMISHDMSSTAFAAGDKGYPINCCGLEHTTKCDNVKIPDDDPHFGQYKVTCLGFTRSAEATDLHCEHGIRQQFNLITSFLDGSTVYGDTEEDAEDLRVAGSGFLKKAMTNLYPVRYNPNKIARELGYSIFFGGNKKVNEGAQVFGSALLFHRAHNKLVLEFKELNPQWDGERLYQEARRIIIAAIQHIVYNEWLPATVTDKLMDQHNLWSQTKGYYNDYDPKVDSTVCNAMATAVMRFGHSMLNNYHIYADREYNVDTKYTLKLVDEFFMPLSHVVRDMDIQRGQTVRSGEVCDRAFANSMQNRLYETEPGNGLDVVSLNIQRGRDHGLPPYADWRANFGFNPITDWSDDSFPNHTDADRELFKNAYDSPLDVDLYTGGVSEKPVDGKPIGPLFAEILAARFHITKKGDRFWYETGSKQQRFTLDQLGGIRHITMSKLLCYVNDIDKIQKNAFHVHDEISNPYVDCSDLDSVDLSFWDE